jgi:hypothetical protein
MGHCQWRIYSFHLSRMFLFIFDFWKKKKSLTFVKRNMISLPSPLLLQDLHHLCLGILLQPQPQKALHLFWLI